MPVNNISPVTDDMMLVSHHLCPYVQRAVIVATEKNIAVNRKLIDLSDKPDWFVKLSPTGKVPLLQVGDGILFESAPIAEFLDEISAGNMHPEDSFKKAQHRAWIEFASATLNDIGALYNAPDKDMFDDKCRQLSLRFARLEQVISSGPWFDGEKFQIVDAAWAPVFRYFDVIEPLVSHHFFSDLSKISNWRVQLASRPSVKSAVDTDYADRLTAFFLKRDSYLATLIRQKCAAAA